MKVFPSLIIGAFFLGAVSLAHGFTGLDAGGIDACVAQAGSGSVIITGKPTQVVTSGVYSDNGKKAVFCEITGTVIKGNNEIAASDDPNQKYSFKSIHPDLVPGVQICQLNQPGLYMIYEKGAWGLQSFAFNGNCNVPMTEGQDGKLYAAPKALKFKNKALQKKFQATPGGKFLGAAGTGPGVSADNLSATVKYLSGQFYPTGGGSSGGGGSASGGGGKEPGGDVLLYAP